MAVGLFDVLLASRAGGGVAVANLLNEDRTARDAANRVRELEQGGTFSGGGAESPVDVGGGFKVNLPDPNFGVFGKDVRAADTTRSLLKAGDPASTQAGLSLLDRFASADAPLSRFQRESLDLQERSFEHQREVDTARVLLDAQRTTAQIGNLNFQQNQAIESATRNAIASKVQNVQDYQAAIQGNNVIAYGLNGLNRYQQLEKTLLDPNASNLDRINAAVLFAQIVEKGLAVRGDDRVAAQEGAEPGMLRFQNEINQMLAGEVDVASGAANILRTARNIMQPVAAGTADAIQFWREQGVNTPGVGGFALNQILGFTLEDEQQLRDFTIEEF